MDEIIPINHINFFISNLVKKNLKKNIIVKGLITKLIFKNENYFFTLKNDSDYQINYIFWKSNNKTKLFLKNDMVIKGTCKIDFNLKYGTYHLNFLQIQISEDNSNNFEELVLHYKNLGLFNKNRIWENYNKNI